MGTLSWAGWVVCRGWRVSWPTAARQHLSCYRASTSLSVSRNCLVPCWRPGHYSADTSNTSPACFVYRPSLDCVVPNSTLKTSWTNWGPTCNSSATTPSFSSWFTYLLFASFWTAFTDWTKWALAFVCFSFFFLIFFLSTCARLI